MIKKLKYLTVPIIGILFFHTPADISMAETYVLEEIIVRAQKDVGTEDFLEIREIRKTPAVDIGEALDAVEGISIIRKGAIANDVMIRGFNRDNLNVLIDGTRIYGACPNRMDPAPFHIDFAEVSKISVLKGPFDVRNAGSLGGTINTKTIVPGQGNHADFIGTFGSYENINAALYGSAASEKGDISLGYSYRYSLPYEDGSGRPVTDLYPDTSPNRYLPGQQDESAYEINTFWTKLGLNMTEDQRMSLHYTRQEADDVIYPYLLMDAVYDNTNRVNWSYEMKNLADRIDKAELQVYWNNVHHDMTDGRRVSSTPFPGGYSMRTYAETETYGAILNIDASDKNDKLSLGLDYYLRNWDGETTLPTGTQHSMPDVDISNLGLYSEIMRSMNDSFTLTAGARLDYNKSQANDDRSQVYQMYNGNYDTKADDLLLSGNIQLLYDMDENYEIFLGGGISSRPPDPAERYFALLRPMNNPNWVGNPGLDPADNREIDLGLKFAFERINGKITVYYSDVKNYISVVNNPGNGEVKPARSYSNVDATFYGGEFSWVFELSSLFQLDGGLAYTNGRDDTMKEPLPEIPPLQGNIALSFNKEPWSAGLIAEFAARQDRINTSLGETETPGWAVLNFTTGFEQGKMSVRFAVKNILDRLYSKNLSYQRDPFRSGVVVPEIGRSFFLTFSYGI
jgi:iron complex outermembrane receptor protein